MSGHVIRLIPEDNYKLIPAPHIIQNLRSLLDDCSIFCDIHVFDSVQFIDQGGNFEYVACPFCSEILDVAWWQEEMSRSFTHNFEDLSIHMPCCNLRTDLNRLKYHLPAGFARFTIESKRNEKELTDLIPEMEGHLGFKLRVVKARY
ncbi:hypothetical protein [Paenibacillus jilunlii]|uniref:Uncharacterized protein n=1 Tax=Paenibacillus jilunlii TaxID=682956 RepID=A0A1G9X773_9BACL|nr:hypothetical protein [Paenibacillus jilunlii]SDM92599.1 hypothetical protein SAMN05216191_12143 [Paenibacillus jilunlii]